MVENSSNNEHGESTRPQIFVIRLWQEPRELLGAPKIWRGMIEHVPSGDRRYFDRLTTLVAYFLSATQDTGMAAAPHLQFCLKLCLRLESVFDRTARSGDTSVRGE